VRARAAPDARLEDGRLERSSSDFEAAAATYFSTEARCALVVNFLTSACSGESTRNVAPQSVSGRVVKTVIVSSAPSTEKRTSAPSERPIHSRCWILIDSGQSRPSRSASRRSAYAVILSIHCFSGRRTQGKLPRSERPLMTSSLASTVFNSSHHHTGTSAR